MMTLERPALYELEVRKSRFLACVEPVRDRRAARERVEALRAAHPGATHVCWALLAGGQSAAVDDGEPSGTAGLPMLRVLRHHQLDGVLATVVRYFGGVKLGAGGLVRAYTDAVAQALAGADKVELVTMTRLRCRFPYPFEGRLRRELEMFEVVNAAFSHGAEVTAEWEVAETTSDACRSRLEEIAEGTLVWLPAEDEKKEGEEGD